MNSQLDVKRCIWAICTSSSGSIFYDLFAPSETLMLHSVFKMQWKEPLLFLAFYDFSSLLFNIQTVKFSCFSCYYEHQKVFPVTVPKNIPYTPLQPSLLLLINSFFQRHLINKILFPLGIFTVYSSCLIDDRRFFGAMTYYSVDIVRFSKEWRSRKNGNQELGVRINFFIN